MLGGETPAQVEVPRRGEAGELPQLMVEVGLVVIAGPMRNLRPVDVAGGVDRIDELGEPVRSREALRRDPHQVLEPRREMCAADAGGLGQARDGEAACAL